MAPAASAAFFIESEMLCKNGLGTDGISKIFLPLTSAMLKAAPGAVKVGNAFLAVTLSMTACGTPAAAGAALLAAAPLLVAAGALLVAAAALDEGAAAEVPELLPLLEQAANVRAPTARTAAGQSLRDVYIDTPCFHDPHVGLEATLAE
jgi:hypothetical protein